MKVVDRMIECFCKIRQIFNKIEERKSLDGVSAEIFMWDTYRIEIIFHATYENGIYLFTAGIKN